MEQTTNPKQFLALAKILLMPSLVKETFGRIVAEALCNGIPVLASDSGTLPETLGMGGIIISNPERLINRYSVLPSANEVREWVDAIESIWDDDILFERLSALSLLEAERWKQPRYNALFLEFFAKL